jgi:hypothetical protein
MANGQRKLTVGPRSAGHAWARKSLENVGDSLIFGCDLRKLCEEWNL